MNEKILIIDDEADFANLLASRLRLGGYEVFCYAQGNSAYDTSRRTSPDLILLDIDLPDISGFEVYKRMRAEKEVKKIPIVFFSALHEKENYCRNELNAEGFLKKPCGSELILRTIQETLAKADQAASR
ncbi:MAG: response regulator [Deltaproteobacteria bacterium]|nr:response regulator [Deltaproteobacteria bacterium]